MTYAFLKNFPKCLWFEIRNHHWWDERYGIIANMIAILILGLITLLIFPFLGFYIYHFKNVAAAAKNEVYSDFQVHFIEGKPLPEKSFGDNLKDSYAGLFFDLYDVFWERELDEYYNQYR